MKNHLAALAAAVPSFSAGKRLRSASPAAGVEGAESDPASQALALLQATERLLGVRLCYHDYLRCFHLPYAYAVHESELCMSFKRTRPGVCHGFCGADGEVDRLIRQHPDGWVHLCPLGVLKIAVAIFYEGGLAGVLFAELSSRKDYPAGPAPWMSRPRLAAQQSQPACQRRATELCVASGDCAAGPVPAALIPVPAHISQQEAEDRRRLLCAIALQMGALIGGGSEDSKSPADGRRGLILRYIEETLHGPAELQGLGRALNLSASRAGHLVREIFRRSFRDLALEARCNRAALLLAATEVPLSEIALRLGFTDQSHFTRTFRQHFHQTPASYRRQYLEHH